jgi:hypothetical protein
MWKLMVCKKSKCRAAWLTASSYCQLPQSVLLNTHLNASPAAGEGVNDKTLRTGLYDAFKIAGCRTDASLCRLQPTAQGLLYLFFVIERAELYLQF